MRRIRGGEADFSFSPTFLWQLVESTVYGSNAPMTLTEGTLRECFVCWGEVCGAVVWRGKCGGGCGGRCCVRC
jgi:hypothetical protein